MGMPKYKRSVDKNQKEIVRRLNRVPGVVAIVISQPLDLLVGWRGVNYLIEIKNPDEYWEYTDAQIHFRTHWTGQFATCTDFEQILELLGITPPQEGT